MGQLVELVFEEIPSTVVTPLVGDPLRLSTFVCGIEADGESLPRQTDAGTVVSSLAHCAVIRLEQATIGDAVISNPSIRLLRIDDAWFDVELNFDLDDIDNPRIFADGLHSVARQLAERHSIERYFAGLEPAANEETRLFTGINKGPFYFP